MFLAIAVDNLGDAEDMDNEDIEKEKEVNNQIIKYFFFTCNILLILNTSQTFHKVAFEMSGMTQSKKVRILEFSLSLPF